MWTMALLGIGLVFGAWLIVAAGFAKPIHARWKEPVFKHPMLGFESDDWGAGPLEQAEALSNIASLLAKFADKCGKPPVMSLAIVLEVPDGEAIAAASPRQYSAIDLANPRFAEVRAAIEHGRALGVFEVQLHGACHYWPPAVMAAAERDPAVWQWLTSREPPSTERLPPALQSRWIDCGDLPSKPIAVREIESAVEQEAALYRKVLGLEPHIVVPMTFVWTAAVERAWRRQGVMAIITCGRRATARDSAGKLGEVDRKMLCGQRTDASQFYLIRDTYFEPALGHTVQKLVEDFRKKASLGRTCLVEIHRFNFLESSHESIESLGLAVTGCLREMPDTRFISPRDVLVALSDEASEMLERNVFRRIAIFVRRLREIDGFRRCARLTGLSLILWGRL